MNTLINDLGETVISVGAPCSKARCLVQYPNLIRALETLYLDRGDSPGRAIDRAIEMIRECGVRSETETNAILSCTLYGTERRGSVTALVMACAQSNKELFQKTYTEALRQCVLNKPELYAWPVAEVGTVASRMLVAIDKGSFSHEGPAFKGTCKILGIKPTRTAILAFWNS